MYSGFHGVRVVGQSSDRGADVLASKHDRRWLFQVKHWKRKVGLDVIDQTIEAMRTYRADIPVVVSYGGFDDSVRDHQRVLLSRQIPLQLWDQSGLLRRVDGLPLHPMAIQSPRKYQEDAIRLIVQAHAERHSNKALVVMATGLGKTFTACESIRRLHCLNPMRVLVIAHRNEQGICEKRQLTLHHLCIEESYPSFSFLPVCLYPLHD